jgi:FkbM family methyltransferase
MIAKYSLAKVMQKLTLGKRKSYQTALDDALERIFRRDLSINTVVDVGASDGSWSKIIQNYLPEASYLLVEANPCHQPALNHYKNKDGRVDYVLSAAGGKVGQINFDAGAALGGVASELNLDEFNEHNFQSSNVVESKNYITVPVTTIDHEVSKRKLLPPYFLKLDVHGYEIPILEGAKESLLNSKLVEIEVYNFDLTADSYRFHKMIEHMESLGFRVVDFCDPLHRTGDGAFWQMDLFFMPKTDEIFSVNKWN